MTSSAHFQVLLAAYILGLVSASAVESTTSVVQTPSRFCASKIDGGCNSNQVRIFPSQHPAFKNAISSRQECDSSRFIDSLDFRQLRCLSPQTYLQIVLQNRWVIGLL
ncbi:hypothetical protein C8R43DRAFT_1034387 [Mycena crocata]|nr:hypothetical protein C8R43DRAFT_1034387 [Mycena crocata]